ncbi:MAG: hypothetical protein JNL60_18450 [Bacteroidia bacterium]|nr:hypothetical protein [Bacteroidia bacterium]
MKDNIFSVFLLRDLPMKTPSVNNITRSHVLRGIILTWIIFTCGGVITAQKKDLAEGDKLYAQGAYGQALTHYMKAYESKKERPTLLKMADCSYLSSNYVSAQSYYKEYFKDTVYEHIPQYTNYAKSCKYNGDLKKSVKLYRKFLEINPSDTAAKAFTDLYGFYLDSVNAFFAFDLDLDYNCIDLDASESIDSSAAPMFYLWRFDDGTEKEGIKFEHCFDRVGDHKVTLSIRDKATGILKQNDTTINISVFSPPVKFKSPSGAKQYFFVNFDASETEMYGYEVLDYVWDLDNGEYLFGKTAKYKYNTLGDYTVKLSILMKDKYSGTRKIASSYKKLSINNNYAVPSKTFSDTMNENK